MALLTVDEWMEKPGCPLTRKLAIKLMSTTLSRRYCKNVVHPDDLVEYSRFDKRVIWERPSAAYPKGRPRLIERTSEAK